MPSTSFEMRGNLNLKEPKLIEKWDEKRREWTRIDSAWGMYGAKDLLDNLGDEIDLHYDEVGGASIPVCVDEEEMKYEFDNVEMRVNEFE